MRGAIADRELELYLRFMRDAKMHTASVTPLPASA
jgi:hypothetical protein